MSRPLARICDVCRRPLYLRANPYYGVGLAVHEWMYMCNECGWTQFLSEDKPASESAPEPDPVDVVLSRRLIAGLRSAFGRPKITSKTKGQ